MSYNLKTLLNVVTVNVLILLVLNLEVSCLTNGGGVRRKDEIRKKYEYRNNISLPT